LTTPVAFMSSVPDAVFKNNTDNLGDPARQYRYFYDSTTRAATCVFIFPASFN